MNNGTLMLSANDLRDGVDPTKAPAPEDLKLPPEIFQKAAKVVYRHEGMDFVLKDRYLTEQEKVAIVVKDRELAERQRILWRLFEAKEIRSPWAPGMVDVEGRHVIEADGDWTRHTIMIEFRGGDEWAVSSGRGRIATLDLEKPGTVAGLLYLLREMTGDPYAYVQPTTLLMQPGKEKESPIPPDENGWVPAWNVWFHPPGMSAMVCACAYTEGEALLQALIALGEEEEEG